MKYSDVLPLVTTPLALAALALLVGAGILRAVAKKKNAAHLRSIVRSVFVLALVFGVLANASFVVTSLFGGDSRMGGTVRDQRGQPLDGARVELDGSARTITLDDGSYQLVVPPTRRADEYTFWVRLPGYEPHRETFKGPHLPRIHSVTLTKEVFRAEEVIRAPQSFRVRHHLGNPIVDVQLQFVGSAGRQTTFAGLRAELVNPAGEILPTAQQGTFAPLTFQFSPMPMPDVVLNGALPWILMYRFVHSTAQPDSLLARANQEWMTARQLHPNQAFRLSDELLADIRAYQDAAWMWTPGKWKLRISGKLDGQPLERTFEFELKPNQITQLHTTDAGYTTGNNLAYETTFHNGSGLNLELR